ncbi:MAG TPA: hypothetical protein VLW50_03110 [Streptosporangiaceae bacterium]|nr:hypothetical protein [Streptosporangiaceae bacterium]
MARYNPAERALVASRQALLATPDWGVVSIRLGLPAWAVVAMGLVATTAFRAYQRAT